MTDFINLPWPQLAAMVGFFIGAFTLFGMIIARFGPFRDSTADFVQGILGITALREDLNSHTSSVQEYIVTHTNESSARDKALKTLAETVNAQLKDGHT